MNYEDTQEFDNLIVLNDDEGNEMEFEFLDLIEYEGGEYVVLLPTDEEDDQVVILKVEGDDETENYVEVEDEDTLMSVYGIFREKFEDVFDFEDGEQ